MSDRDLNSGLNVGVAICGGGGDDGWTGSNGKIVTFFIFLLPVSLWGLIGEYIH